MTSLVRFSLLIFFSNRLVCGRIWNVTFQCLSWQRFKKNENYFSFTTRLIIHADVSKETEVHDLFSCFFFSVSNTVKRACLIWFSVLVFGNQVTVLSAFGTVMVMAGVFLYQRARHIEAETRNYKSLQHREMNNTIGKVIPIWYFVVVVRYTIKIRSI